LYESAKGNSNPWFEHQWGLKNEGPGVLPWWAIAGIDIKAEDAWEITKGNPDIKIAILDERVQLDHPDLTENILHELVYEATQYPNLPPGPYWEDYRGTWWAGIIAAVDNDIGIIGVAPECKIVPVRIGNHRKVRGLPGGDGWTDDLTLMRGIRYAWDTARVDIIHCAWGGNGGSPWSGTFYELQNAATLGRGGKGCVIVAPSGILNPFFPLPDIDWPARFPFVIGVGAIDPDGYINEFSQFGNSIDFVAPGDNIVSTTYDSDYAFLHYPFGYETAYACAFVSGIAALMLSVNPCLTQEEVRKILAISSEKLWYEEHLGIYSFYYTYFPTHKYGTWNNEMGYGLVNAYKSVMNALVPPDTYDVPGVVVNISDPLTLSINNNWFWWGYSAYPYAVPNGRYTVKRYEINTTVTYNYPIPSLVQGIANGFSADIENDGRCFMEVVNVSDTEATLRTYVYEVLTPGSNIEWIPAPPEEVRFHIAIMSDNLHTKHFLQNETVTTTKNYNALTNIAAGKNVTTEIPIGDYVIQSNGKVSLRAGETITLSDGFHAHAGSYLKALIEPLFICDYVAPGKRSGNVQQYVINDYIVKQTETTVMDKDYYLKLYPNPSAGEVTVEYNLNRSELVEITLHDNFGKLVYKLKNRTPHDAGVYKITLNGVELPNGIYFCTLKTETGQKTEKLMIAR
jgi:hypothetical protein